MYGFGQICKKKIFFFSILTKFAKFAKKMYDTYRNGGFRTPSENKDGQSVLKKRHMPSFIKIPPPPFFLNKSRLYQSLAFFISETVRDIAKWTSILNNLYYLNKQYKVIAIYIKTFFFHQNLIKKILKIIPPGSKIFVYRPLDAELHKFCRT